MSLLLTDAQTRYYSAMIPVPDLPVLLEAVRVALAAHEQEINDLNVFPVPDGDTGTNMLFTFESGMRKALDGPDVLSERLRLLADGCLLGSRGNSGVLLSQMARGFAEALEAGEAVGPGDLAIALKSAFARAYASIDDPCEGTMLTVMRAVAEAAAKKDSAAILTAVVAAAHEAVLATTGQLAVLREANVVDAGGYALALMLTAAVRFLDVDVPWQVLPINSNEPRTVIGIDEDRADLRLRFCTEYVLSGASVSAAEELREALQGIGDCVLVVGGDAFVKVHVHSNTPGVAVALGEASGSVSSVKINDMAAEAEARRERLAVRDTTAVLAVASGDGVERLLCGFEGVDVIAQPPKGNPSTEEFLRAIQEAPQQRILVMPNNRNAIAAAEQAASLSEKQVAVVLTYAVPEALSALLVFDDAFSLEENAAAMSHAARGAKWGLVTRAARARKGLPVGGYFSLVMGSEVLPAAGFVEAGLALAAALGADKCDIITLIVGYDARNDVVTALVKALGGSLPEAEIELHHGGQPIYELFIMVE